jgi:DNA-binding transcriptional LysR family regulator
VELRHIRYFVQLAEELHFGRAAEKLHIAQPALSLQIQALENELGVKLLVRNSRNVQLTASGIIFLERAQAILDEVKEASVLAQIAAGKDYSKIHIGTIYPATFSLLPGLLASVQAKYPDLQIHLRSDTTDNIVTDLQRGRLNFGFIRPVPNMGAISYLTLRTEHYRLAVPKKSPLATMKTVCLRDLRSQTLIALVRSNVTRTERYFSKIFQAEGLIDNIAYTCDDTLSLLALVSAGVGIGFVPEWAARLPSPDYALKSVQEIDLVLELAIAWKSDDRSPRRERIIDIARRFGSQAKAAAPVRKTA